MEARDWKFVLKIGAFAACLLLVGCATWWQTGRVVDERCLHVGVRPASDAVGSFALTVQVTTDWPVGCAPDAGR